MLLPGFVPPPHGENNGKEAIIALFVSANMCLEVFGEGVLGEVFGRVLGWVLEWVLGLEPRNPLGQALVLIPQPLCAPIGP